MKVLVTGANGFIGSNLCARLARHSGMEVTGLVRPTSDLSFLAGLERLRLVSGDIGDPACLAAAMRDVAIVYHVAGFSADWGPWQDFRAANVEGVRQVMEAARRAGVRRVVHISSVSIYGFPGGVDIAESAPFTPRPQDRYITTKAEGERLAMSYHGQGLEVVVIRPAGVYGPCDRTTTVPLAVALLAGKFLFVDGGSHIMAPVYIDNLLDMMELAGHGAAAPGEAFNAVDDGYTTWRQYIEWLCADLGCTPPRLSLPSGLAWPIAVAVEVAAKAFGKKTSPLINTYRLRAVMQNNHYNNEKAKRLLNWRPAVSTREGVRRAAAWYLNASPTRGGGSVRSVEAIST